MKLRLTSDSIRLRLGPAEVGRLVERGQIGHRVAFAPGQSLAFTLAIDPALTAVRASFDDGRLRVELPAAVARRWAGSADEVSIRAEQPVPEGRPLSIRVEKDFECLHGEAEDNADTFPHPGG